MVTQNEFPQISHTNIADSSLPEVARHRNHEINVLKNSVHRIIRKALRCVESAQMDKGFREDKALRKVVPTPSFPDCAPHA